MKQWKAIVVNKTVLDNLVWENLGFVEAANKDDAQKEAKKLLNDMIFIKSSVRSKVMVFNQRIHDWEINEALGI